MTIGFDLSDLAQRHKAWWHARDVLAIPEFVQLGFLIQNCGILDEMVIELENRQSRRADGELSVEMLLNGPDTLKIVALSDMWVLGFFEVLRIVCGSGYAAHAEIGNGTALESLKKRANMVRSAFAKLQPPGLGTRIFPSHSSIAGPNGTVFAVYDETGADIYIPRRAIADDFLTLMHGERPSTRFQTWLDENRRQTREIEDAAAKHSERERGSA